MKNLALIAALALACAGIFIATAPPSGATSTQRPQENVTQEKTSHATPVTPAALRSDQNVDYRTIAREDAQAAGISPDIFERQIEEESGFNPRAVSPVGAIGIAQFMPATARALGVNPLNPVDALKAASLLMARYYHAYGDYAKALAAYNAGPGMVAYAVAHGGSLWRQWLPLETQNYIVIILGQ